MALMSLASQMNIIISLCVFLHFEIHLMLSLILEMLCGFGNDLWDFLVLWLVIKYVVYKTNHTSGYLWTLILPQLITIYIAKPFILFSITKLHQDFLTDSTWGITFEGWSRRSGNTASESPDVHLETPLTVQLLGISAKFIEDKT